MLRRHVRRMRSAAAVVAHAGDKDSERHAALVLRHVHLD